MNFDLSSEAQMLQDSLRRFLSDSYDADSRARAIEAGYSPDIWAGLADLGVIGALFTEDQGGFGGTGFDIALIFEELGRAGAVDPLLDTGVLASGILADLDDPAGLLDEVIAGSVQLAFAHGEPGGRYGGRVQTVATQVGDDWHLAGRKAVVVNAPLADHLVVSARNGDEISLYLAEKGLAGIRPYPVTGGGMAAEVTLENVPATYLGPAGDVIARAEARATLALCAEALGLMEHIRTLTIDYLKTRKQFGRPIGSFQVLQHRMADVLIEIEQARSAVVNLAGNLDGPDRDRHVSATKNLVGEVARLVVEESIQMHGGIGMTTEYELGHFAKRLTMVDHRFGDALYHLERFIALSAA